MAAAIGLGEVFFLLARDLTEVTDGVSGIPGVPHLSEVGIVLREDWQVFYLSGCFVVFLVLLTSNFGQTRLGRACHAIRTNETAAQTRTGRRRASASVVKP